MNNPTNSLILGTSFVLEGRAACETRFACGRDGYRAANVADRRRFGAVPTKDDEMKHALRGAA
jgi:hypothetical protein